MAEQHSCDFSSQGILPEGLQDPAHWARPPVASSRGIDGQAPAPVLGLRLYLPEKTLQGPYVHSIRVPSGILRLPGPADICCPMISIISAVEGDASLLSAYVAALRREDDYIAPITNL